ncbi:MAG: hypothetical protein FAF04_04330 [Epsilonproteobacteria bacterium]|nr:hypothetical protein [Campylobacterota bacterium]
MKYIIFSLLAVFLLNACSAKEINETTDSITSDIINAFENSKDKSN